MRRSAVAWLLCVIASGVAAQAPEPAPSVDKPLTQPQGDASGNKATEQPQRATPPPIIVNVQPAPHTEAEAQKEERERQEKANLDRRLVELTGDLAEYTKWLAYATAALFAVTAGLFYFALRQANDAKETGRAVQRSADAADRSAKIAEKALGGAEPPYLYPILEAVPADRAVDFPQPEHCRAVVGIKVINFGRSPALLQLSRITLEPRKVIPDPRKPPVHGMRISAVIPSGEDAIITRIGVGKGIEKSLIDGDPPAPDQEWLLFVHGDIVYQDLGGDFYSTRVCQIFMEKGMRFVAVGGQKCNGRYKLEGKDATDMEFMLRN